MEKALVFLPDWLAVGMAVLVFFSIGMLMAKWIWGRHAHRLATAVDENMNLVGQWSSLGGAQHDLFKKLRSRWQADRDSWEEKSEDWKGQMIKKDETIRKLVAEVKRLRKANPNASDTMPIGGVVAPMGDESSTANKKDKIAALQDEIAKLKYGVDGYSG